MLSPGCLFQLQSGLMKAVCHTRPRCFSQLTSLLYNTRISGSSYHARNSSSLNSVFTPPHVRSLNPSPAHRTSALTCFRWKQTEAGKLSHLSEVDKKEFTELYFIKNISFLRVLCRFSKLSVAMFLFATPASFFSAQLGIIPTATGTNIVTIFAAYAIIFTTQSWLFSSRIVGKIMLSSDDQLVKVSHLSLFGDRRDVFLKPSDFVPDKRERSGGFIDQNLCQVRIRNYPKRLLFMPHQGHVDTDHERIDLLLSGQY
ncbi:hypothetical protein EGW08_006834 [Elysia chlorotica]|uniref:Transmembrane protein 186 n=1 Tax=Elysia chlorotica TaxID=188477 RepID=A0A3S1BJT6_ELYCH|nr:hypothetical protein EGW08_006834 [Elysia chlorotica]